MSANGRAPLAVSLHASGAETVSSAATSVDLWAAPTGTTTLLPRSHLELYLDVSAYAGTSFSVAIETSRDGVIWSPLATVTASAVGSTRKVIGGAQRYVRARWTFAGTSVTFALTGEAVIVYATPADLDNHGIPSKALVDVTDEQKAMALRACSAMVDGRLTATMTLPLSKWDEDLRAIVCDLAVWRLLRRRGFNPESPVDSTIRQAWQDAMNQLRDVQTEKSELAGATTDATPAVKEGGVDVVFARARRGWDGLG